MQILYATLILLLVMWGTWAHARHQRRVAQAKLDISKVILEMDEMMLKGEITLGDVCHDHIYEMMLASQRANKYDINWTPWRFFRSRSHVESLKAFVVAMQEEMKRNPKVEELFSRYIRADFCVFRFSRPIIAIVFTVWVAFCIVGLAVIIKGHRSFKAKCAALKLTVAECYSKLGMRIADS